LGKREKREERGSTKKSRHRSPIKPSNVGGKEATHTQAGKKRLLRKAQGKGAGRPGTRRQLPFEKGVVAPESAEAQPARTKKEKKPPAPRRRTGLAGKRKKKRGKGKFHQTSPPKRGKGTGGKRIVTRGGSTHLNAHPIGPIRGETSKALPHRREHHLRPHTAVVQELSSTLRLANLLLERRRYIMRIPPR